MRSAAAREERADVRRRAAAIGVLIAHAEPDFDQMPAWNAAAADRIAGRGLGPVLGRVAVERVLEALRQSRSCRPTKSPAVR